MAPRVSVFGIRHHGPGSARSLLQALEALEPDCLLVEGPPDADAVLPWCAEAAGGGGMEPPVAILVYRPQSPQHASFFPFAEFSPEWQAIRLAQRREVPVRFIDLPQAQQMALAEAESTTGVPDEPCDRDERPAEDPLGWLGRAAGYGDGEDWWESLVEQRRGGGGDLFAAVREVMGLLRERFPRSQGPEALREARREAFMRRSIRRAQKDGFERIAVVCGAWHAPALAARVKVKDDDLLLKGLPRVKVEATWVAWTAGRLASRSGYGAGVESPGWYEHLWRVQGSGAAGRQITSRWLTRVARLLRERDLDCSSAHVIEAVRLAESLAALRQRPTPGLVELNEASLAVMCLGEEAPLRLIQDRLTVGDRLGRVPEGVPTVPLQRDLEAQQRRLRLKASASEKILELDLRKESGLERSRLLHRLRALGIPWGERLESAAGRGTFREVWKVCWRPELSVSVIEAARWGTTVLGAATGRVLDRAAEADLPLLSSLVDRILLADLEAAVDPVMRRLEHEATRSSDASQLIDAAVPLIGVLRYGSVRKIDGSMIERVVVGLMARLCAGLAAACASLDEAAAASMIERIERLDRALGLLRRQELEESWRGTLGEIMNRPGVHQLLGGRCCRLLLDAGTLDAEAAGRRMSLALSTGNDPARAAAWLEGFLRGGGLVLLHDDALWRVLDEWLTGLGDEAFLLVLPLVRRTFATFEEGQRRQMGRRVRAGMGAVPSREGPEARVDERRGARVLPVVRQLFGLEEQAP
ncbi:MAG: DUF5682 family protein [Acidobacteriota bacterium]